MAGYDPAKAARMNALAQQYPRAPIGTLATLANIPASDLGNYTNDSVGTRASNANFGRVTSETSQTVQSTDTARNTPGSGTAFQGGGTNVASAFDNRVDETAAFEQEFDGQGQTPALPTPRPAVPQGDVDFTDAYGDSYTEVVPIPPSTRRPGVAQATVPIGCLLYTSPSPRDGLLSRMPSSA